MTVFEISIHAIIMNSAENPGHFTLVHRNSTAVWMFWWARLHKKSNFARLWWKNWEVGSCNT